jgi:hypothetical protein
MVEAKNERCKTQARRSRQAQARSLIAAAVVCHRQRHPCREVFMCRNIKTLYNFKPPATDEEIRASSVQFVRKLSGFARPSKANQAAFSRAVEQVAQTARELLDSLVTDAPPRDREIEAAKARARAASRFPPS